MAYEETLTKENYSAVEVKYIIEEMLKEAKAGEKITVAIKKW